MKAEELRKTYPEFIYKGYSYELKNNDLHVAFDFAVPARSRGASDIAFRPKVVVKNVPSWLLSRAKQPVFDDLVFQLGLAEMPSYWKATASPNIIIEAGYLNKTQINWWHDLFMRGMGQYFYENNIDFRPKDFLQITSVKRRYSKSAIADLLNQKDRGKQKILVPIGGGKDAVVTYEILKGAGEKLQPFVLNPKKEQKALLREMEALAKAGKESPVVVERTIDPKLLELNRERYLNGHTPFSAYLAFLTTFCAALFDFTYIALSNERSSNEGNARYLGSEINHQYSKSWDFEKKFRAYSKTYLATNSEYFSFLRPLYELQIAKLFAHYPRYFATFLSCNEAHKTNSGTHKPTGKWCGTCSKCLFVFATLYPFVQRKERTRIFTSNLFENAALIPLMEELVGERNFKPLECVGTTKESLAAFYLSLQKTHPPLPALLKYFRQNISKKHPTLPEDSKALLSAWNQQHALPAHLEKNLKFMLH